MKEIDKSYFIPSTKKEYKLQNRLNKAKKNYPIGTKFKNINNGVVQTVESEAYTTNNNIHVIAPVKEWEKGNSNPTIYKNGKWAEIVKPKSITENGVHVYDNAVPWLVDKDTFKIHRATWYTGYTPNMFWYFATEKAAKDFIKSKVMFTSTDGVDMYKGDTVYIVNAKRNCSIKHLIINKWRPNDEFIGFSTKEAAEKWIKDNTEKTLKDYEDILCKEHQNNLSKGSSYNGFTHNITKGLFYRLMKENEPKLYWTKILWLVEKEFTDERKIKTQGNYYNIVREINDLISK